MHYYVELERASKNPPKCVYCTKEEKILEVRFRKTGEAVAAFRCENPNCRKHKHRIETFRITKEEKFFFDDIRKEEIETVVIVGRECPRCGTKMEYNASVLGADAELRHAFVCPQCRKVEIFSVSNSEMNELLKRRYSEK